MSYFSRKYFAGDYYSKYFGPLATAYRIELPGVGPVIVMGPATVLPGPIVITLPEWGSGGLTLGSPQLGYVITLPAIGPLLTPGPVVVVLGENFLLEMTPIDASIAPEAPEINRNPTGSFFNFWF